MKNSLTYKIAASMLAVMMLTGCQDLFEDKDITTNPNSPTDAPFDVLLSAAEVGLMTLSEDTDVRIAMMWSGQLTGTGRQHLTYAKYQVSSAVWGWDNYWNTIANARLIQEKTAPLNNRWPLGVAQVIEALAVAKLTGLWGDVPYSEALNEGEFPHPKYDKQADIYAQLQTLLTSAISNLSSTSGNYGASFDFIGNAAGGNTPSNAKWIAGAHTLKARLYLHTGDYANAIAEATLGITAPGGDMLIPHGESYGVDLNWNNSFFTINRPGDTGFSYSENGQPTFLPSLMKSRATGKTNETALYNHYFQEELIVAGSLDPNTDDGMFTADAPHPVLTFYENQLIRAEAHARRSELPQAIAALNSVRAVLATGYINGKFIEEKYQDMGIAYDPFIVADFPGGQTEIIREILTQKYIVMLGQYEVFTDVRRAQKATPVVTLGIAPYPGAGTAVLPERYIYPQNEINTNPNTPNPPPAITVPLTYF